MRPVNTLDSRLRRALPLGTLVLAGCVPSGFVYDLPQDRYYSNGNRYYSATAPGYYGQSNYYGQTGYYPPVVYVDHDHDRGDCRHESHRDRRNQRNDRDRADVPAESPRHPRASRGINPRGTERNALREAGRSACAGGKKCGPAAEAPEVNSAANNGRGVFPGRSRALADPVRE